MMKNKLSAAAAILFALALPLTGCMNDTARRNQTAPTAAPDYMPGTDGSAADPQLNGNSAGNGGLNSATDPNAAPANPGNTSGSAPGALTPFDWANGAAKIEGAIARISEIAESRVVVTNSTALVGVRFDNVYKGKLTERIREMVAAEVLRADPTIQTVAVTSDAGDVQKVYQLSDQIRAGRTADELAPEINAIVRNATTMR